ncbi:hypothetical protein PPS11_07140 [Pseudomonas putida S11]|nr:hypothetical protein PPS11_07140 [Pseudomonas putida S11]
MIGQVQPRPAAGNGAVFEQLIQQADKSGPLQRQGSKAAQAVAVRAELVGLLFMEPRQLLQHLALERLPPGTGKQQLALPRSHHQHIFRQLPGFAQAIELPFQTLRVDYPPGALASSAGKACSRSSASRSTCNWRRRSLLRR